MGTIADKLSYLAQTKGLIKEAIEDRGVTVQEGTAFRRYADLIGLIASDGIAVTVMAARRINGKAAAAVDFTNFSVTAKAAAEAGK